MVALLIILIILVAGLICLMIFKREWLNSLFGNSITDKVEKKKKIEGEVEVLKKEQKVASEAIIQDYDNKKTSTTDTINAQINALQAQIASLKNDKVTKCALLDEERKVALDKCINDYDRKIVSKQNQVKRLTRYIDAEQKNMDDVIHPDQPNAPRNILNEDAKKSKKK